MISPSQDIERFDPLTRLLVEMAQSRDSVAFFPWLAGRLTESYASAAAAAVWQRQPGAPAVNGGRDGIAPPLDVLDLAAVATRAGGAAIATSDDWLERSLRQWPLAALDAPFGASDTAWIAREEIERFVCVPLEHRGSVVGALGVFLRNASEPARIDTLRLIANQAAVVVASERAFEEILRLRERLEASGGLPATSVVSEADIRRFERANVVAALKATGGRVYGRGGAAELLGVKPTTLASRLKKLGLSTPH